MLPSVAFILYRILLRSDEGIELDHLASLAGHPTDEDASVIRTTVEGLQSTGIFRMDDDQVSLGYSLREDEPSNSVRAERTQFRLRTTQLVLGAEANNFPPESEGGATDFVRGLCWYLLQNPASAPARFDNIDGREGVAARKARQLGDTDDTVLRNNTRWGAFTRWSTYLGFCRWQTIDGDAGIMPDPTAVLADLLLNSQVEPRVMTLESAVELIGEEIPVLDTGEYWSAMASGLPKHEVPSESEISPALSHSLLRLHEQDRIRLTNRSDAETMQLRLEGKRRERFSHIELRHE